MHQGGVKTGIVVLGQHSSDTGEVSAAGRACSFLVEKGYSNVRTAFHRGSPSSETVMDKMFAEDGVDTFCVLPLVIAEGEQSVWRMPRKMGLPDNCGSWRMSGEHDIAVRFSTALGCSEGMAEAVVRDLGSPRSGAGVVVLSHGSKHFSSGRTADFFAERISEAGWDAVSAFTRTGARTASEAEGILAERGCSETVIVPLFIGTGGKGFADAVTSMRMPCTVSPRVSEYDRFYEILGSKVPEGW